MEEIGDQPLISNDEDLRKSIKRSKTKSYILMGVCVAVGLLVGVFIGYFSFRSKDEGNDQVLQSSNNEVHTMAAVNLNINCDINQLIRQIGVGLSRNVFSDQRLKDGSRFVSTVNGGWVIAAYNHPTRWHTATAVGGWLKPTTKSSANAGQWAIAKVSSSVAGRKTYYGF